MYEPIATLLFKLSWHKKLTVGEKAAKSIKNLVPVFMKLSFMLSMRFYKCPNIVL